MMRGWSREWIYFLVSMSLWCFVPELRRVLDWRSGGFSSVQVLSLLPLLSVIPLLFVCLRRERLTRLSPVFRFFAACWLVAFSYALVVGILAGNGAAAIYSYLTFVVPVIAGLWIATQELPPAATMRRLGVVIVGLCGVVGIYGIVQFVSPPPWDVLWVLSSDMESVGAPEPFLMRVFSTLNSVGPCGDVLALALVLGISGIGLRAIVMWPLMTVIAAALTLTLVRSAWLALVVGVVVYVITSPRRMRTIPMIAGFALVASFLVVSLPALLGADSRASSQIVDRIQTLSDIGHDGSALERQGEIDDTWAAANDNPIGGGLGLIGAASKLSDNSTYGRVLDSGYLSRFLELGYLGTALYAVVIVGSFIVLLIRIFASSGRCDVADRVAIASSAALCAVVLSFEAAGDSYYGIVGLVAWLAIGTGFHWQFNFLAKKSLLRPTPAVSPQVTA